MSLFVFPLVLGNKHFQYLMNIIHAQPVTVNELLTCLLDYESGCNFSPLLQYTITIPFSILQSINRYGFCILNAYLPSEATRLKMSIPLSLEQWRHGLLPLSSKCASVYRHVIRVSWLAVLSTSTLCKENSM